MSKQAQEKINPTGELMIKTIAAPVDANVNGDIFGGWIMSQMDIGGAILAKEISEGAVVTISAKEITFLRPIGVSDVVSCYAECIKTSKHALTINVEVWIKKIMREPIGERYCVTEGTFIYVPIDAQGQSRELPIEKQYYDKMTHSIDKIRE